MSAHPVEEHDTEAQSEDDVEELEPDLGDEGEATHQRRRVKSIAKARDGVRETRKQINEARLNRAIGAEQANTLLRSAVEDYILEVEYLIREEVGEAGEGYWTDTDLGTMHFSAPSELLDERPDYGRVQLRPGQSATVQFEGLKSVVEAPEVIGQRFTLEFADQFDRDGLQQTVTKQIPQHILMNAFRAVNDFLGKAKLDLKYESSGLPRDQL